MYHKEGNWKATADTSAALIKLDPYSFVAAYLLNAVSNMRLGNVEQAEASARQAVKLDTRHTYPEAEYTLGLILASRGAYKEGAEHLRSFLQLAPNSPGAEGVKQKLLEFEKAAN